MRQLRTLGPDVSRVDLPAGVSHGAPRDRLRGADRAGGRGLVSQRSTALQRKIGVCGHAEGGLVAFYAAAVDPRIDAALVSGYFDCAPAGLVRADLSQRVGPAARVRRRGDRVARSAARSGHRAQPRARDDRPQGRSGARRSSRACRAEVQRIESGSLFRRPTSVHGDDGMRVGPFSDEAVAAFARHLGVGQLARCPTKRCRRTRASRSIRARGMQRLFKEMEGHVQRLIARSDQVRDKFFLHQVMPELADGRWSTQPRHPDASADKFIAGAKRLPRTVPRRRHGPLRRAAAAVQRAHAQGRRDGEVDRLRRRAGCLPGVVRVGRAGGAEGSEAGRARPVVVCQHGRNGVPRDTLDANKPAYNNFAAALAERGFITFAPHNLYRGEDRYRWLGRKANTVKATLFSFIIAQHDQILRWLGDAAVRGRRAGSRSTG